jgi:hypothetical protein
MGSWLAATIEDNEMDHVVQLGKAMPFCEPFRVIFANQTVDRCVTVAPLDFVNGIDCVGRWWPTQLAVVHCEPRLTFNRRPQHC